MPSRRAEPQAADTALVMRITEGDERALALLYDRYAEMVYSVALRILGDAGAAEEILQDIFYQLWRTADRFDSARGSLPGWLLVTARNRAISRLRGRPRQTTESLENLVTTHVDLEAAAAQRELLAKVNAALEQLSPSQRHALELAYFEGLTHSEIAQRTGEPLGTVKTRLRAALEILRRTVTR